MTECLTFRYVQKLLKTKSTVHVQLDEKSWKKYKTFQKYSVESPWKFRVRKMYNYYKSFEKIKFKDWIFLGFNMKCWVWADRAHTAFVHANFKSRQLNFYGLSNATRKKHFRKLNFFTQFLIDLYYKLYYHTGFGL